MKSSDWKSPLQKLRESKQQPKVLGKIKDVKRNGKYDISETNGDFVAEDEDKYLVIRTKS